MGFWFIISLNGMLLFVAVSPFEFERIQKQKAIFFQFSKFVIIIPANAQINEKNINHSQ